MTDKLDVERVADLLDVVHKTINLPSLAPLGQVAMAELTLMAKEVAERLAKEAEEARKKSEAESAVKAAEAKRLREMEAKTEEKKYG